MSVNFVIYRHKHEHCKVHVGIEIDNVDAIFRNSMKKDVTIFVYPLKLHRVLCSLNTNSWR